MRMAGMMWSKIASDTFNEDVEISTLEASQLRMHMDQLSAAAELEELYHLLISDYIEFEATCLTTAVEYSAGRFRTMANYDEMRRRFNSCLMHLLTLTRAYLDCAPKLMMRVTRSEEVRRQIKELMSQEYDSRLGYRVMEALRNSAQHHGLPLHSFQSGLVWIPSGDKRKGRVHTYSMPTVQVDALTRDSDFKKKILEELRSFGESFDIRPMVRQYIEGISKIQFVLRLEADQHIHAARSAVATSIERWKAVRSQLGDDVDGAPLYIVDVDVDGQLCNEVPLNLRPCEIFDELRVRNPQLANLSISFVSNSVDEFGSMKSD